MERSKFLCAITVESHDNEPFRPIVIVIPIATSLSQPQLATRIFAIAPSSVDVPDPFVSLRRGSR